MNLFGWDTAYATTIANVNQALADSRQVLDSFSLTEQDMSIQGQFGSWLIIEGGSGQLLHLQLQIVSGVISGDRQTDVDLAGISVQLEINLSILPSAANHSAQLTFNFKTVGNGSTPSAPGVVTPLRVLDPIKQLSFTQTAFLAAGVAQYLVNRAADVSFVFADINLVPPDSDQSWLTPVETGYAYYQTDNGNAYLVVLATTDRRDTGALSRQVDPQLTLGQGNAFFAISESLFLEHVIRPVMPKVYPSTDASCFRFDTGSSSIKNTQGIGLPGVKSGLITYSPVIEDLTVTVADEHVVVAVTGTCDMHMGMNMTFSVTSRSAVAFDPVAAKLSLMKDPNPQTRHQAHIPWYDYLLGGIPDLIMAIVVPVVADGIADSLDSIIGNASFARVGPLQVRWQGMNRFTITAGELKDAFRLSGALDRFPSI